MKLQHGNPGDVGLIPARVERIKKRCAGWVEDGLHPALAVIAARKGIIFLEEAYGKLTPEADAPNLQLNSIFGIASITKTITSTCAMILVEDGLLGLNRPVQEYIPEFVGEGKEQVMIHHLFTHTMGSKDQIVADVINKKIEDEVELPEREENQHPLNHRILHYGYSAPLNSLPGEVMRYNNFGIFLLAEVIRRLTSMSLESFAWERLFMPLGMRRTHYVIPKELQPHVLLRDEASPGAWLNDIELQQRPHPASGVYSSAGDMAIFGQMFLNQGQYDDIRILSPVTIAAMTRNQIPGVPAKYFDERFPEASWGLGWSVNAKFKGEVYGEQLLSEGSYGHGGGGGTMLWIDPQRELLMVFFSVLTQSLEDREMLGADLFMKLVASAIEDY